MKNLYIISHTYAKGITDKYAVKSNQEVTTPIAVDLFDLPYRPDMGEKIEIYCISGKDVIELNN